MFSFAAVSVQRELDAVKSLARDAQTMCWASSADDSERKKLFSMSEKVKEDR